MKTVLITGANSGLGKATAIALAQQGYRVIMVCRNRERGELALTEVVNESGNQNVELMLCDISSLQSIRDFCRHYSETHDSLDILINNAGVALPKREETVDGFEMQLGVNYIGMFALTSLLLPQLRKSSCARIINVTSMAYSMGKINFEDIQLKKSYQSMNAYAQSKLAVVLFTRLLSEKLRGENITVNCLNPGLSGTQMGVNRESGSGKFLASLVKLIFQSPQKGAATTLFLATSQSVATVTGEYFSKMKSVPISPAGLDKNVASKLWEMSEKLTGISPLIEEQHEKY